MTARGKFLLTTAVPLACAVVFLLRPHPEALDSNTLLVETIANEAATSQNPHAPFGVGGSTTGVVYVVTDDGLVVRNGGLWPPPLMETAKEHEGEALENEWDETVSALRQPVTGARASELQRRFSQLFNRLPKTRREEVLRAALNLIPDENVAVVVGLVFDRSQPDAIINMAFSDVLNRSDEIKSDVLCRVSRDPSHPNYVDARRLEDIWRLEKK